MRLTGFWNRLARLQATRPGSVLAFWTALVVVGVWRASHLQIRPQLSELLPDDQPSVVEMRRLVARTPGVANVFVVLEGDTTEHLRQTADRVAARLRKVGPPWVGSADSGVQELRDFLMPRAALFANEQQLNELDAELDERRRRAFAQRISADLDDELAPTSPIDRQRLESLLGAHARTVARYPDGTYQSADGRAVVVVVRSAVLADDLPHAREALARIRAAVVDVVPAKPSSPIRVGYAGDLVTGVTEYTAARDDLVGVGILGLGLVLAVVMVFYLRVRALVLMGVTIVMGCALAFGATEICIGTLNTATGFLFSIVAGNGINCGIIYQSRYLEERARGTPPADALRASLRATWRPTLGAAAAAAAAYGALAVTTFRAFREFAFIGAIGMLLCWLTTYVVLPPLLVLSERVWPLAPRTAFGDWMGRLRATIGRFGAPVELSMRRPRTVLVAGALLGAAGLVLTVGYVARRPLEYNLRRLERDRTATGELYRLSALAASVVGASAEGAMVVLADRLDQVPALEAALRRRRDAAPPAEKPFEEVHSLFDFVPAGQERKLAVARDIRRKILRAHELGALSDDEWNAIREVLPPPDLRAFTVADLPEAARRPFREIDGTVGRLLYIEPTAGQSDSDVHYLLRWADAFRQTRLPNGETIHGSGRAVIYADLVSAVIANAPTALAAALLLTVLAVGFSLRLFQDRVLVLASLLTGLAWMGGVLACLDVRINFVNFVALPITLGVGADYAVNVACRYRESGGGEDAAWISVRATAGPVILCSLTTTLGYLALLRSGHRGVRSLGTVAVVGEICCLLAGVLVLPSALLILGRHSQARQRRIGSRPYDDPPSRRRTRDGEGDARGRGRSSRVLRPAIDPALRR